MKYPITPDYIQKLPQALQRLYIALEDYILKDIGQRFIDAEAAQNTAIEKIRELQRRGYSLNDIKEYIKRFTGLTDKELNDIMDDAVQRNQRYFNHVISQSDLLDETFDQSVMDAEIEAIREQTKGQLHNITQSLGFSLRKNGQTVFYPIADAYQKVLDDASIKVWSGGTSYTEAIQEAANQLTQSGIRTVIWQKEDANGNIRVHTDHADVAARRAVLTGVVQLSSKYTDALMDQTETPYLEITAHQGARDKDDPKCPWANHKAWQGKVYSKRSGDIYPNVYTVCGLGDVQGLEGANCRHMHYPWFEGISERTYTDEQLKNIDPPPFTFQGRKYTAYQATQKMRQIERTIRKLKRMRDGYPKGSDGYKVLNARVKRLFKDYNDFSKASGCTKQVSRTFVEEFTGKDHKNAVKTSKAAEETKKATENAKKEQEELAEKANSLYDTGSEEKNIELYNRDAERREKLRTEYPHEVDAGQQAKHREGTNEYLAKVKIYTDKGEHGPSRLTISDDEAIELVNMYAGKGILKLNKKGEFTNVETITTNDLPVGIVVNNKTGKEVETSIFKIHWSESGFHIVPDYPSKKGRKQSE